MDDGGDGPSDLHARVSQQKAFVNRKEREMK